MGKSTNFICELDDTYLTHEQNILRYSQWIEIRYRLAEAENSPPNLQPILDLCKIAYQKFPDVWSKSEFIDNLYETYLGQPSYDSLSDYRIARDVTTNNNNQITYAEHVLSLAGDDATLEDYRAARNAYAKGGDHNRSVELADLILKRFPGDLTIHDLRAVRNICFFSPMSDDARTNRAVEMAENILLHPDVIIDDYYSAQYVYKRAENRVRVTELQEEISKRFPVPDTSFLRYFTMND